MNSHENKGAGRDSVVGVFHRRDEALRAVQELKHAGFRDDQISLVGRNAEGDVTAQEGSKAAAGAATGAAVGAGAAALASLGMSFGVIPVIGPILAVGPLAAALLSAVGGAAASGLVGGLIGLGIPEEDAHYYEGEVKGGRFLVTVDAGNRAGEAWVLLHRFGAYNRQSSAASTGHGSGSLADAASHAAGKVSHAASAAKDALTGDRTTAGSCATGSTTSVAHSGTGAHSGTHAGTHAGAAGRTATGEETIKLHEEQLRATKQPVEAGEVSVRKEVTTEHKTIDVPVTREEVVIERRPASGQASASDIRPGEEVRIPVREEEVKVEKQAVVKEEVHVGKRQVQDTQQVSGTVRKEEVKVEQHGDVDVRDQGTKPVNPNPPRNQGR